MKPTRTAATVVLAAFLSSSLPHIALAQDDPVTTQARARFKEGVDFYDKGQYENARLAFLQAYALKKHPAVLLNLAQSSAKAGHPLEAAKYFQQFIKESPGASPQQVTDAQNGLAEVRQKLGRIEIVAPAGTDITLDEKERLGTAPFSEPIDVEPGSHSLRGGTETVRVTANAGQKVQAKFGGPVGPAVTPVPVGPPPADTTTPPPPPSAPLGEHKDPLPMWPAYVGAGVAGVTLLTTIIFAISKSSAQSKSNDVAANIRSAAADRGKSPTGICSTSDADFTQACQTLKDDNDKVNTDATLANVSGVLLAVSGVFAISWFIAVPIVNKKREQESQPPPPSTSFFKDVTFSPYAGMNNGGFTLRGGF